MNRDDALDAIAGIIQRVEPGLEGSLIRQAVAGSVTLKPMALELLAVLQEDKSLLTSGSDTMPPSLGSIIDQLVLAGATRLKRTRCYRCHEERMLRTRVGVHGICASCYTRGRRVRIECSTCGKWRCRRALVVGLEWCGTCWDGQLANVDNVLRTAVIGSEIDVTANQLDAVANALKRTWNAGTILRVAMELEVHSLQWFDRPAAGSALFLKLHAAMKEVGVTLNPVVCGRCGREALLPNIIEGLHCCARCYGESKRKICSQCGRFQILVLHAEDGSGMCQTCMKKLPERMAACIECGQQRFVSWNGPDGPVCTRCRPKQLIDYCPGCKRRKPCLFAGTPMAQCHDCSRRKEPCAVCGAVNRANTRDTEGRAICGRCSRKPEDCSNCGRYRIVVSRANGKPLCDYCYRRDPVSFRDCDRCGRHEKLHAAGLCERCAADDSIELLLPVKLRNDNAVAGAVFEVLRTASPSIKLLASRKSSMRLLATIMELKVSPSHEYLDQAGTDQETRAVRALLVDAGLLPRRDDHIARFEKWIVASAERILEPKIKVAFIQCARWRHLRRLLRQPTPIPGSLAVSCRRELRLVIELLEWLQTCKRTLETLTQSDVDRWRSTGSAEKFRVKEFLRWAHTNQLVRQIEIRRPPRTPLGVTGTTANERHRLLSYILHPECPLPAAIRFSASLVLLFGARPQQIAALKLVDIVVSGGSVHLRLGTEPVLLPKAIVELAMATHENRRAPRIFAPTTDNIWLIPGSRSGYPIAAVTLAKRLRLIGISPSKGRTGAMASLAQELPPTILARLTGVDPSTAIRWANAVSASNARYAGLVIQPVT